MRDKQKTPKIISAVAFTGSLFISSASAGEQNPDSNKFAQNNAQSLKQTSIVLEKLDTIFDEQRNGHLDKKTVKQLSDILARMEKQKSMSAQEEKTIGWALNRLANLYCPSQAEPDCKPFNDKTFRKGNEYKRREFELHRRLHPDRKNLITYNLGLLNWYIDRRRQKEVEIQQKILSELLGTFNLTDPNRRSYTCGMLLNDENGNPATHQTGVLGCGLG
jgi:hypothetical protein